LHTIIHRGLAPQTLTYVWLVVTLALTLALAVTHSARASVTGGPSVAPLVVRLATTPDTAPLVQGAIAHHDAGVCRAPALDEERRAVGDPRPPGLLTCATPARSEAGPGTPALALFAPGPRAGADVLTAIYGGAGPNGPPAARAHQPILPVLPQRTTDPGLALPIPSAAANTPSALSEGETHRAATGSRPAAIPFPSGPAPAITTVA
jgi:hypothetical protein